MTVSIEPRQHQLKSVGTVCAAHEYIVVEKPRIGVDRSDAKGCRKHDDEG